MICMISLCALQLQFVGIWRKGRGNTKENEEEFGLLLVLLEIMSLIVKHNRIMKQSEGVY